MWRSSLRISASMKAYNKDQEIVFTYMCEYVWSSAIVWKTSSDCYKVTHLQQSKEIVQPTKKVCSVTKYYNLIFAETAINVLHYSGKN